MRTYFVYIMTNRFRTTIYTGVTSNIARRVHEHRQRQTEGFTRRYKLTILVHVETFQDPMSAIAREKQIKGWSRAKKDALIESVNPYWRDLANSL